MLAASFNDALRSGGCDTDIRAQLKQLGFDVDYVSSDGCRRYGAVVVGSGDNSVRLIDNVEIQAADQTER